MKLTTAQRAERQSHHRKLVADGVEPREAARLAHERAVNAVEVQYLEVLADKAPELDNEPYALKAITPAHSSSARVIPFEIARSALFGVFDPKSVRPKEVSGEVVFPVYGTDGGTVTYKGPQLRQDDRQVFFEALYLERKTPGEAIIHPNQFLVALGWSRNSASRKKLLDCLNRLVETLVVVHVTEFKRGRVTTHLLTHVEDERPDGAYGVTFDGTISRLFQGQYYTQLVAGYERRLKRRAELARWLMVFYSTYEKPLPLLLTTLQEACGDRADAYDFKDKMSAALKQLVEVGFLQSGGITKKINGKTGTERVAVTRTSWKAE